MVLDIKKSNILNNIDFTFLAKSNPEIVERMLRNKMVITGNKIGNKLTFGEMLTWLEKNCDGLIYLQNNNIEKKYNIGFYFEEETDIVAFKLRWA